MPFGMGPAGWFMWPYFAQWLGYWYPYGTSYAAPYSYASTPYAVAYPYAPMTATPYSYAPMTKEQEVAHLQDQAKMLKQEYDRINARLKELQKVK